MKWVCNTLFLVRLLGHYSISREVSLWDFGRNAEKEKSQRVAERFYPRVHSNREDWINIQIHKETNKLASPTLYLQPIKLTHLFTPAPYSQKPLPQSKLHPQHQ